MAVITKFIIFVLIMLTTPLSFAQDDQIKQCERNVRRIVLIKEKIESEAKGSDSNLRSIRKIALEATRALETLKQTKLNETFDDAFEKTSENDDQEDSQEDSYSAQIAALAAKAELVLNDFKVAQKKHHP